MYSLDANNNNSIKNNIGLKEVVIKFTNNFKLYELPGSMLSYDGNEHIFVSDYQNKTVHVYSINDHAVAVCYFRQMTYMIIIRPL